MPAYPSPPQLGTFWAEMPLEGGLHGRLTLKHSAFWQNIDENPHTKFEPQRKKVGHSSPANGSLPRNSLFLTKKLGSRH